MSNFIHSTKVPRIYKAASLIASLVQEKGQSVKELVFSDKYKHFNTKALYALVVETVQHVNVLEQLLNESKVLVEQPQLNPWLARVLLTELLWGKKTLPPNNSKPLTTILDHHDTFIGILKAAVRDGTHQNEPRQNKALLKPRYVRVNTLALSVGDAVTEFRQEGWQRAVPSDASYSAFLNKIADLGEREYLQDFHVKEVFVFPPGTEFHQHELYTGGSLVLQDKATALAAFLLDPPPGSIVLDMCSAPGIKTTQLAAIMKNQGTLYAVEKNMKRYKTMCEFVGRHSATCVKTINADATTLTPQECQGVEFILVDPTCSGSGMSPAIAHTHPSEDQQRLQNLSKFQTILLERAMTNFPKVKRVVYSTCSIFHEENEQVVEKILKIVNPNPESPNFELVDIPGAFTSRGSRDYECGPKCLLFNEKEDKTTGFFVAVFQRVGDAPLSGLTKRKGKKHWSKVKEPDKEAFAEAEENGGNMVGDESLGELKPKKKRRRDNIEEECDEAIKKESGRNECGDERIGKRTAKKLKKERKHVIMDGDGLVIECKEDDEKTTNKNGDSAGERKDKKKKRKHRDMAEDGLVIERKEDNETVSENGDCVGESKVRKEKKKKRKHEFVDGDGLVIEYKKDDGRRVKENGDSAGERKERKEKKQKKRKHEDMCEDVTESNECDERTSIKKKKKKCTKVE